MVNWESNADRGRRPPTRGCGKRSAQPYKPAPSRAKTPSQEETPAPAPAPRGSPIARKLARHSSPWTTLTIPQMAVQVRPRLPNLPPLHYPLPAHSAYSKIQSNARPRPDTATSLRGEHVSRAGSPTVKSRVPNNLGSLSLCTPIRVQVQARLSAEACPSGPQCRKTHEGTNCDPYLCLSRAEGN